VTFFIHSRFAFLLSLILLLTGAWGCSTKKNKWPNRAYHNTTSKYNTWFNGNEVVKEVELTLNTGHQDNFYKIVPVYPLGSLEDSKGIFSAADKAIKKGSMVIAKHNMLIKGKQYNRYIDDAYMLIGKANYYKREYYTALEMFSYVTKDAVKNNKKDPIQHLANIWQARAYTEIGMVSEAQMAYDRSLNDKALPKSAKAPLYTALADFNLRQNNYPKAKEYLILAVQFTRKKQVRSRLMFVLAQVHQKLGELKEANALYEKVLKMNPSYEVFFYSRINKARCFSAESGSSKEIRELLIGMLKDPKNIDLNDQIYYVLGEIEEKEEHEDKAIEQYNKSLRANTTNTTQKGLSYLAIAELYFSDKEYRLAAAYYDSTIGVLPKDYQDYKTIENTQQSLAELVKRYNTIERYDSLLRMSKLNPAELDKKIESLFAQEEAELKKKREAEEAERKKLEQQASQGGGSNMGAGATGGPGVTGNGQWYFYNPSAMGFGFSEFRKIWGERKLEDNWRRSNKQSIAPIVNNDNNSPDNKDGTANKDSVKVLTRKDSLELARKKYLADLPKDEKTKEAYADSVREAFYALGMIYRERLNDLKKSVETFEEFLKKYPKDPSESAVFYQLYRIFLKIPDPANAEKYKQLLVSRFPDSEYAKIILDPNFFAASNLSKKETEMYYEESYRLYKARQFEQVIERCRNAEVRFTGNALLPKFTLLKAMAIGQLKDVKAFETALKEVVKGYPGDTVEIRAKELLLALDRARGISSNDSSKVKKPSFVYKPDTTHYMVISIEDRQLNLNDLKVKLSNFNGEFYSTKNLSVTSRILGTNFQIITVQAFANKKEGMDYLATLDDDGSVFEDLNLDITDVFIMSPANYQLLMKEANVKEYIQFYRGVYE
jgi:tetratricopeptide (TPR) repeat protein